MPLRIIAILLLSLALGPSASAQQSHTRTISSQAAGESVISSDELYVINMPSQFMRVQLVGRLVRAPGQVQENFQMSFSSYSAKPLYEPNGAHTLRVKSDDKIIDFGLLSYSKIDAKGLTGLPPAAVIAASKNSPSVVETMTAAFANIDELNVLARAESAILKIGDTVFPFTPAQLGIVREFVQAISAARATLATPATGDNLIAPADVPSDDNRAPLDTTLHWIKTQPEKEGSTKYPALERKLEPLDFNTCSVRYRLVPLVREVAGSSRLVYVILEFQMNLADIDSAAVRVANLGDYAMIPLNVEALAPKIKVIKHANENGTMGQSLEDSVTSSTFIYIKNVESAHRLRFAMIHAIHLCQNQRK